jgi:hypothetical protein
MFQKKLQLRPLENFAPSHGRRNAVQALGNRGQDIDLKTKFRFHDENEKFDRTERQANKVNAELLKVRLIPTVKELHEVHFAETPEEYFEYLKKPKTQETRRLAQVNEFFIGLSYLPFYQNPYLFYKK